MNGRDTIISYHVNLKSMRAIDISQVCWAEKEIRFSIVTSMDTILELHQIPQ